MRIVLALFCAVLLVACSNNNTENPPAKKITKADYEKLLKERNSSINELHAAILNAIAAATDAQPNDSISIGDTLLGFSPVIGTHTNEAEPYKTFNAILVASYIAEGKSLPAGMEEDWLQSDVMRDIESCKNGKPVQSFMLTEGDERLWSTGAAFVNALAQLRYVVIVHPAKFYAGVLHPGNETFETAELSGTIVIYDLKEKRVCGAKKIQVTGPETINYSYDKASSDNGWKDKSGDAAAHRFKTENREVLVRNVFDALNEIIPVKK